MFAMFFLLAACYASRLLFGADTMKRKLETANLSMDGWFTGADFPQVAVDQLGTAVRRRYPSSSSNFFVFVGMKDDRYVTVALQHPHNTRGMV